jgi:YD repeat-containing protein
MSWIARISWRLSPFAVVVALLAVGSVEVPGAVAYNYDASSRVVAATHVIALVGGTSKTTAPANPGTVAQFARPALRS